MTPIPEPFWAFLPHAPLPTHQQNPIPRRNIHHPPQPRHSPPAPVALRPKRAATSMSAASEAFPRENSTNITTTTTTTTTTHSQNIQHDDSLTATRHSPAQSRRTSISHPAHSVPVVRRSPVVVDARFASAVEAHHWITVSSSSVRLFERAAVAHADTVRSVERHAQTGSLHRWVLRAVHDPATTHPTTTTTTTTTPTTLQSVNEQSRYVVMETFKHHTVDPIDSNTAKLPVFRSQDKLPGGDPQNSGGIMRRWLSAIERLGSALSVSVVQTLQYQNLFTAKLHHAKFDDVDNTIVVVESFNAADASRAAAQSVQRILEEHAEASVARGSCLEFCVLEAIGTPGLFKTIEVYPNAQLLHTHMDGLDVQLQEKITPFITRSSHRSRSFFKPVVFA